jgi:hypothetical protein
MGRFMEHADLPTDLAGNGPKHRPKKTLAKPKEQVPRTTDDEAARKAALAFEKEERLEIFLLATEAAGHASANTSFRGSSGPPVVSSPPGQQFELHVRQRAALRSLVPSLLNAGSHPISNFCSGPTIVVFIGPAVQPRMPVVLSRRSPSNTVE